MNTCFIIKARVYSEAKYRRVPNTSYIASIRGEIINAITGRVISPSFHYKGYLVMKFGYKNYYIHRLVCAAWHGLPSFDKAEVDHIDGVRDNNVPSNLKWVTSKENKLNARNRWHTKKARVIEGVPF